MNISVNMVDSGNIPAKDRLKMHEGTVTEIIDEGALWTVWCEFEE